MYLSVRSTGVPTAVKMKWSEIEALALTIEIIKVYPPSAYTVSDL
jgi:hypothetical protein